MSARAKAIHAFFLMLYQKVPAVAIVSGNGELVGNLSASDLRVRRFLLFLTAPYSTPSPLLVRHLYVLGLGPKFIHGTIETCDGVRQKREKGTPRTFLLLFLFYKL
jgi:hypothetical protein